MKRPEFDASAWGTPEHLEFMQVEGWLDKDEGLLLNWLAAQLPAGARVVEIGSYKGKSAVAIASALDKPGQRLYCIDPFDLSNTDIKKENRSNTLDSFVKNTNKYGSRRTYIQEYSYIVAEKNRTARGEPFIINMLWIDGDHTSCGLIRDIKDWTPLLQKDGIIAFHDIGLQPVKKAIEIILPAIKNPIKVFGLLAGWWNPNERFIL